MQPTPPPAAVLTIPFRAPMWQPDGGDARWALPAIPSGIESNGFYIRVPRSSTDRPAWREALAQLRQAVEAGLPPREVQVDYRGVRAWVRMDHCLSEALNLQPGEPLSVEVTARWTAGNPEICLALDYHDRATGAWKGWSTVLSAAALPADGQLHTVRLTCTVPQFDPAITRANIIVGQDATHNPTPGRWMLSGIVVHVPASQDRRAAVSRCMASLPKPRPIARLYNRRDLTWAARNFACYFLFLYDTSVYDRQRRRYRTAELLARWQEEFGGVDSVVLWQAYPRIGVDPRNQFDHYRDMPGGLTGLRRLVREFHAAGVRCFIAYNPWDTGTRREPIGDAQALARMVAQLEADGIFLDTMTEAPADLRAAVDRARRGVVFEPEGAPGLDQLGECSSSWAQWFPEFPEPGLLLLKWLEPRHMQHQIRRWSRSHAAEIRAAFLNGSGMLIWENIFGPWNPWSVEDRAAWRRLVPILRRHADELSSRAWEPDVAQRRDVLANRWQSARRELILFAGSGKPVRPADLSVTATTCYDLIARRQVSGEEPLATVSVLPGEAYGELGALVVPRTPQEERSLRAWLAALPDPPAPLPPATPPDASGPPIQPSARTAPARRSNPPPGMVYVPGGEVHMRLRHQRRECGCYADPSAPPERRAYWIWGDPFSEEIVHDYRVRVAPFFVDECLVTNGEYDRFLRATGYRPAERRNFLRHWPGGKCVPAIRDLPVVYVDLDDCRAYARWAGKRLPTEAEWQLAAQGFDGRKWPWGNEFQPGLCNPGGGPTPVRAYPSGRSPFGCYDMTGNVYQWTESEWDDGHTRSAILRGGSWFEAKGSIWYVQGGPQPLDTHTRILLLYPGLDRSPAIGFRCVQDAAETGN